MTCYAHAFHMHHTVKKVNGLGEKSIWRIEQTKNKIYVVPVVTVTVN